MPDEDQNQPAAPAPSAPPPTQKTVEAVGLRVSLIPAEEIERADPAKGFRRFLMAVIVFAAIAGATAGGLWFWVNSNLQAVAKLDAATADLTKKSQDLEPSVKDARSAQARLKALSSLLAGHKTGLKIFSFLEKNTLPDVSYSSISMDASGTVNLTVSTASFESYAAQVNELRAQPEIKSLTASSLSPSYDEKNNLIHVDFTMSLMFDPAIFLSQAPTK